MIEIRQAMEADAVEAVTTLRRSITELCVADHQNDPSEIEDWLGNKTVETWRQWITRDDAVVLVAERNRKVIGVGMATLSGNILLNYVHPDARFGGVSKAILSGLEDVLRARGIRRCRLESTVTAQSFYESCGFRAEGGDAHLLSKSL
ncbi:MULTISPECIES: GNAT family N-acetyltransferase [Thioclava]|uniref:GNAT family N-acetyltransferase n=1 Tax=Thioclava TaxID=285107 RepID=UPI000C3AF946|nr:MULTISPECIES: GNAT family N-acetyltransferase [Thioclava]MAQ39032.1 GNAT family N-acetyltransferase [Thioclava sp.]|tara:strand:- start:263 stop:706 length:444 start_codon:yes stop_codon:yes gene_type:complete